MLRGLGKPLACSAISLVGSLLVGEMFVRFHYRRHIDYDIEMSHYSTHAKIRAKDPAIGHVHRPGASLELMGVHVAINDEGLRDRHYGPKRPGTYRVAFLGDSLTFGWGVPKEQTFESILEDRLDGKFPPLEILNFGVGNFNTVNEVKYFLETASAYRPDHVVIFFFINDPEPTPPIPQESWLASSDLVTLLWSRATRLRWRLASRDYFEYYKQLFREENPGWGEMRHAFENIRDFCHGHGIRLQVILLPELHQLSPYRFENEHRRMLDLLAADGIEGMDAATAFHDVRDPQSYWVAADDAHPNARAHRKIAEAVEGFIARRIGRTAEP